MVPVWLIIIIILGLLVALFFFITTWWSCFCLSNQESSYPKPESGGELEEVTISVDVVSNSAQRKHLHPDCEDRFEAEKISNRVRGHEKDTVVNTIFKLKNIPKNFEELQDQESGIKYLRSKEFVKCWASRRDDGSQPFMLHENIQASVEKYI